MQSGIGWCDYCGGFMIALKDGHCEQCLEEILEKVVIDDKAERERLYLAGRYGVLSNWGNISDYWLGRTKLCE